MLLVLCKELVCVLYVSSTYIYVIFAPLAVRYSWWRTPSARMALAPLRRMAPL